MTTTKFVAYYRVSTQRQGLSGLGLEAQREAVARYLAGTVGATLVQEFVEVESGKRNDRPELAKAMALCRAHRARLVIAKLDRLARNVEFTARLVNDDVDFVAVDNPHATKLTIHILAATAEHEREQISLRTKAALAAAKARGVVLGSRGCTLTPEQRERAVDASKAVRVARAVQRTEDLMPAIERLRAAGASSLRQLAAALEAEGFPTPSGRGRWQATTVQRVLAKAD